MDHGPLRIFSGTANLGLARLVVEAVGCELGEMEVSRFNDGEVSVQIRESIRGKDCFIVQPTCPPVNDNLVELLIMIDAFRRGSAERITAVIPYFGYARQDRKAKGREPISAKLVANLITTAGADRVLAIDLHTDQLQGFFDLPLDHLAARRIFADHFRFMGFGGEDTVVVAPDVGGVHQAKLLADELDAALGIVVKRRSGPGKSTVVELIGDFDGRRAILYDDMIDTGGSMIGAAFALMEKGCVEVHCAATHAVLSRNASERLHDAPVASVVCTDTILVPPEKHFDKLTILSVAPLLADAIGRIHRDDSVSACLRNSHYRQPRLL
ncbi:MAG: ribose-phosphate pyrophosphokinase [Armatimonadetes bacterium]|nr:ribose-phosphate pyrophosphokinase [Armatimonadota bacterium]